MSTRRSGMIMFAVWLVSQGGLGHLVAAADRGGAEPVRIRIVLGARAQPAEAEGAKELSDYVLKATGTTLSIGKETDEASGLAIVLGTTQSCDRVAQAATKLTADWKGLGLEGFIIKRIDGNVYITANTAIGVRHGCYDFLESFLGIRWLKPVDGDYVPKSGPFTLPDVNKRSVPVVATRILSLNYQARPPQTLQWLKRQRMNCKPGAGGHFYYVAVPPSLFEQHPEYFALVKGKRVKENAQLCTSNPEVQKLLAAWAVKQAEAGALVLNLGMNDTGGWCECEACRALDSAAEYNVGTYTTRYLKSLEMLADTMAQKYPQVALCAYCYAYAYDPPKGGYRPRTNLILKLYTSGGWCYFHGCDDRGCPCTRQVRGFLEQWQKTGLSIGLGGYLMEEEGEFLPTGFQMLPIATLIASEIRLARDLGGVHWQTYVIGEEVPDQGNLKNVSDQWWSNKLTLYVAAKLTWNPDLDENTLGKEFYQCFFGSAGEPLWQAYQLMSKQWCQTEGHSMYVFPSHWAAARFMTQQLQDQLAKFHREALALVPPGDASLMERVQREVGFVEKWKQLAKQTPPQAAMARRITWQGADDELLVNGIWDKVEQMPFGYTRKIWEQVWATNAGPCHAQLAWDAENVYLRVTTAYDPKSRLPEANAQLVKEDNQNKVTGDCKLEMYVNPLGKRDSYYNIYYGSDNILHASYSPMGFVFQPIDKSAWRACQSFDREKRVWRVLFIFPVSAFNQKSFEPEQQWAIGVKYFNKGIITGWPDSSLHDTNASGILTLTEEDSVTNKEPMR